MVRSYGTQNAEGVSTSIPIGILPDALDELDAFPSITRPSSNYPGVGCTRFVGYTPGFWPLPPYRINRIKLFAA
jgi:hypothetical protein